MSSGNLEILFYNLFKKVGPKEIGPEIIPYPRKVANFSPYFSGLMVSFKLIWVGFSVFRRPM
jgi:hypothetical protein